MSDSQGSLTMPVAGQPAGALTEMQGASLGLQLNKFMAAPMDAERERRFASMLLDAEFEALVQVDNTGKVTTANVESVLKMSLGVMTYLADGQQYFPVFTEASVRNAFLKTTLPDVHLRTFSFTTAELMTEAKRIGIAGILVNPGKQSFPLTSTYWDYINHVIPVVDAPDGKLDIAPLPANRQVLGNAVVRRVKRLRGVSRAWAAVIRRNTQDAPAIIIVVQYTGNQQKFAQKWAPELARLAMPLADAGQDVIVGTTNDPLGAAVSQQCAPIYPAAPAKKGVVQ